nr:hypothetical protein [Candidatus Sigynarchaeota archaeon]
MLYTTPVFLIYPLIAALAFLGVCYILYRIRFRFPPFIRKVHDFKNALRFGRSPGKIRLRNVRSRQAIIEDTFKHAVTGDAQYVPCGYSVMPFAPWEDPRSNDPRRAKCTYHALLSECDSNP